MGMAMGGVPGMIKQSRADGGLAIAASGLRAAREMAISSRRNVRVIFGTNTVINVRVEYRARSCTPTTTTVRTTTLEGRVVFREPSRITPDTGDAFGEDRDQRHQPRRRDVYAGIVAACPMFTTDGSFINSTGDVHERHHLSRVPNEVITTRAISIFGPTGAMRLWKWDGRAWVEV